jgi:hypothetical protein
VRITPESRLRELGCAPEGTVTRTLLNTFPTWLLVVLTVGCAVALSVGGLVLVRRRFPTLVARGVNEIVGVVIGVIAALFGILLGFVTIALYQDYTTAHETVRTEATELVQLYDDSRAFPPPTAAAIEHEIESYVAAVRFSEWKTMRDGGDSSPIGDERVGALYRVLRAYDPDTHARTAFYEDAVERLNDVVDARRARLNDASDEMPGALRLMLVLGAALLIGSLCLLGTQNRRLHVAMVVGVAVITSFNLLVVAALDNPFSGDIAISNEPFDQEHLRITPANGGP